MKKQITFKLGRTGRLFAHSEDEDIKTKELDDKTWANIQEYLGSYEILYNKIHAKIEIDWLPILQHKNKVHELTCETRDVIDTKKLNLDLAQHFLETYLKEIEINATIEIYGSLSKSEEKFLPEIILEKYLYDVFIISNLTSPGSCDFFNIAVRGEKHLLSSHYFDCSYNDRLNDEYPFTYVLEFKSVLSWYKETNSTFKITSEIPIEKALFSIMHLCKRNAFDETSIIWVFHALEALFSTRVGEGFSNLINRISLLLELTEGQKEVVKKKLRKMYDFRGALVHGGYKVPHPIRPIDVDEGIGKKTMDAENLCQYGFNIIIASIQKMIKNNWREISVIETISGK